MYLYLETSQTLGQKEWKKKWLEIQVLCTFLFVNRFTVTKGIVLLSRTSKKQSSCLRQTAIYFS